MCMQQAALWFFRSSHVATNEIHDNTMNERTESKTENKKQKTDKQKAIQ